jgi:oleandomycin transport system ATP-binding protein
VVSAPVKDDAALTEVVARLSAAGIGVTELSLHLPSLDEVFFSLVGRRAGDDRPAAAQDVSDEAPSTPVAV